MEQIWLHGNLSEQPFSYLIYRIWKSSQSGYLEIKAKNCEKKLAFRTGNICLSTDSIDEITFLQSLHEKKQLSLVLQKKCQKFAGEKKLSHIAALLELGIFSPEQLWEKLEGFFKEDNFWLFDSPKAEFFFNSEQVIQEHDILVYIPSLEFIQQGVRKMGNHRIIKTHLPAQDEKAKKLCLTLQAWELLALPRINLRSKPLASFLMLT